MTRSVASIICGPRTKYAVLAFWIAVLAAAMTLAPKLADQTNDETSSWLPGSAESTLALEASGAFASPNLIPAVVVYEREGGITAADREQAAADAEAFGQLDGLAGEVRGPVPSPDGAALQTYVPLDLGEDGWELAVDIVEDMRATAADGADGMATHIAGPAGNAADSAEAFAGIDTTLLLATVIVVVFILLLTYRSPVLWLLPVLSAGVALMTASAVIALLAEHTGLTVNSQSSGILTVLVFGAGTDYALLLVARYREELRRHSDRHEAMAVALHRAGPAIVASAGTVVLGMLCLVFAEMNSTQGLGPVAAIGVAVGLLAMVTLLPALLVIVGRWIFWPVRPQHGSAEPTSAGVWARTGNAIARRPRVVWIGTALVLGAMSLGILRLDATGLTTAESFRGTPDSVMGEQVLAKHFESDAGSPVTIISSADTVGVVREAAAATSGIAEVGAPRVAGGLAYMEANLSDPPTSDAAYATIERLRDTVHVVPGADALVGGNTALNLDIQEASQADNNLVIPLVLAVVFVILALLLRAFVAPFLLIATVVLSFGAALGVSALVFEYIFEVASSDSSLPLFVFVFLVALGIDYNIFLMTRVREEALKHGTRRGAVIGLSATGGVITSAGLVLAGTFSVLASLPVTFLTQMGFAVAFGVLLDTLVVRSVLVTALNLDLGSRMWWPSRLSRTTDDDHPPAMPSRGEPVLVE